jgi:chemotaxis-related protein WspD
MTQEFSSAAAQLLERHIPVDYQQHWTRIIAAEQQAIETASQAALVFRIGSEWLALPIGIVREIAENRAVHTLPHRRAGVLKGITNVRGEILLCVALERLLGLESPDDMASAGAPILERMLVCDQEGDGLAFRIHEVHGVHRYLPSELHEVPITLAKAEAKYTRGILLWKNQSVAVLDPDLVFYALHKGLA